MSFNGFARVVESGVATHKILNLSYLLSLLGMLHLPHCLRLFLEIHTELKIEQPISFGEHGIRRLN